MTVFIACLSLLLTAAAVADTPPPGALVVREVAAANQPIYAAAPPGDTERLFVVQRGGAVRIFDLTSEQFLPGAFVQVAVDTSGEGGLLGMAFHPQYATNGRFYLSFTTDDGGFVLEVVEFQTAAADPNAADPGSARPILTLAQPDENHNGGWIGFGPDGFLYLATGDGGGSDDNDAGHTPGIGNAQDLTDNLLGKMLRVDVDGDDFPLDDETNYAVPPSNPFVGVSGDDEIWANGLRNPWRVSFDRMRGDLYIADVGQRNREEINFQPAASTGGENYGWRLREGRIATPTGGVGGPRPPGNVDPVLEYAHGSGPLRGNSVTGGYVYRGPVAALRGQYFFADFINRNLWSFPVPEDGVYGPDTAEAGLVSWNDRLFPQREPLPRVASFAEDGAGRLYLLDLAGEIYRIEDYTPPGATVPMLPYLFYPLAIGALALAGCRARRVRAAAG